LSEECRLSSQTPQGKESATPLGEAKSASNLLGIVCVIAAVFAFTTQDMGIKWLSGDYALHQIVLIRAFVAMTITLGILVPLEGGYRNLVTSRLPLHLARGLAIVVANMTFFTGLASLPIGEATALFFVAPLFITALSVLLLGEKVGLRRWVAVLIGLSGVIVMLRPGDEIFRAAALLPVAAAFAYATVQIITRKLGLGEKASTMAFYIQLTFIFVSTGFGLAAGDGRYASGGSPQLEFLLRAWVWPSAGDALIIFGIGVLNAVASYLISQAYRTSEAGLIAPFEYLAMPLALFWGVVMWGEWPDGVTWIGIALIGGAGLYVFYRETIRGALIARRRPMPRNR
jgi:drug/metabolite transporter (DMT)-like permease